VVLSCDSLKVHPLAYDAGRGFFVFVFYFSLRESNLARYTQATKSGQSVYQAIANDQTMIPSAGTRLEGLVSLGILTGLTLSLVCTLH
jgi:hypothetical protein